MGQDGHGFVEVVLGEPERPLDLGDVGESHAEQGVDVLIVALLHLATTPPPPLSRSASCRFKVLKVVLKERLTIYYENILKINCEKVLLFD